MVLGDVTDMRDLRLGGQAPRERDPRLEVLVLKGTETMLRTLCVPAIVIAITVGSLGGAPALADGGELVGEVATSGTPHVLDGQVNSIALSGSTMVLGGEFSKARGADRRKKLKRLNLLAFNTRTGRIRPGFRPNPDGAVNKVLDAGDGRTVYVAGDFTRIGGVARQNLARLRLSDGSVVRGFKPGAITGQVRDLQLIDGRLWLAGAFTHVGGHAQRALATVDPRSGKRDPFMSLKLAGQHNGGHTQVLKIDVSETTRRLVAVGNFRKAAGKKRRQLAVLAVSGRRAKVASFRTRFYTSKCSRKNTTYLRDVDVSPDGSFFVVSTTGGHRGPKKACDTTARFETGANGSAVRPSWVAHTGGDTTYAVEVTRAAVYVGGHFRWQNNPLRKDRAGPGAVSRQGIAALDPRNGLPLPWNPGRTLGVGVFDFLDAADGLWVASDTDRINWQLRGRIARLRPHGLVLPPETDDRLPGVLYATTATDGVWSQREWTGRQPSTVGEVMEHAPSGVRAAFMLDGVLFHVGAAPVLLRRSFDGVDFGPVAEVNPADQVLPPAGWAADLRRITGMFHDNGRIYYTLRGSRSLYYRYFTAVSGVVGARRLVADPTFERGTVEGLVLAGGRLHWRAADGTNWSATWRRTPRAGRPVASSRRAEDCACEGGEGRVRFLLRGTGSPI